jgi:hypothetical protein
MAGGLLLKIRNYVNWSTPLSMEAGQDRVCPDCGTTYNGNYCPNCGRKYDHGRITAKSQLREFVDSVLNIERFFLKTTVDFILRPGNAGLEYLQGKRRGYHRPHAFGLLWATIYFLVHNLIAEAYSYDYVLISPDLTPANAEAKRWLYSHMMWILVPSLIIVALPCYLILGIPAKMNYFEMLTLTFYAEGCLSMYRTAQDVIAGVVFGLNVNHEAAYLTIFVVSGIYNIWFCYDLFKRLQINYLWPRLIISFVSVVVVNKFNFDYLTLFGMSFLS